MEIDFHFAGRQGIILLTNATIYHHYLGRFTISYQHPGEKIRAHLFNQLVRTWDYLIKTGEIQILGKGPAPVIPAGGKHPSRIVSREPLSPNPETPVSLGDRAIIRL